MNSNHFVVNFQEKLVRISEHWAPRVIAQMNDYQFKLVKILGGVRVAFPS